MLSQSYIFCIFAFLNAFCLLTFSLFMLSNFFILLYVHILSNVLYIIFFLLVFRAVNTVVHPPILQLLANDTPPAVIVKQAVSTIIIVHI